MPSIKYRVRSISHAAGGSRREERRRREHFTLYFILHILYFIQEGHDAKSTVEESTPPPKTSVSFSSAPNGDRASTDRTSPSYSTLLRGGLSNYGCSVAITPTRADLPSLTNATVLAQVRAERRGPSEEGIGGNGSGGRPRASPALYTVYFILYTLYFRRPRASPARGVHLWGVGLAGGGACGQAIGR